METNSNIQLIHAPITTYERLKSWLFFHMLISGAILNGGIFVTYIFPPVKATIKQILNGA